MKHASFRMTGLLLALAATVSVAPAAAQEAPQSYNQVISANPFGLLLEWFNAEYEHVVSESATAGAGGSFISSSGDDYVNADVFYRYYPQGRPLDGWAFGGKAGVTNVDSGTYFGFGFDVNKSWLLGKKNNFYVGMGFGLKRLVGVPDTANFEFEFIPTIRIINIGFAF